MADYGYLVDRANEVAAEPPRGKSLGELLFGEQRMQLWPERLVRGLASKAAAGLTAPGKAYRGELDPLSGEGIESMAGLAEIMTGVPGTPAGALGSSLRLPRPAVELADYPGLVSSRFPTAASRMEDPLKTYLQPNVGALRSLDPERYEQMLRELASYPGMTAGLRGSKDLGEIEGQIGKFMRDNLRSVYDAQPGIVKDLAARWYSGANKYIGEVAKAHDLPMTSAVGTYAALSPNYEWFKNVAAGDRLINIIRGQQSTKTTDAMLDANRSLTERGSAGFSSKQLDAIKGKTLGELDPKDQVTWVRLFDEAQSISDPSRRSYREIAPTGEVGPLARTGQGDPKVFTWPYGRSVENAIRTIRAEGDVPAIRGVLGERHKVPSFYNDILHPHAPSGDVVADVQHIGAALFRPLGGKAREVNVGQGAGSGSDITGIHGAYPFYVDPTQQVAKQLGIPPSSLQSVDWEGIRALFNPSAKRSIEPQATAIWREVSKGERLPASARKAITDLVEGGYQLPSWVRWVAR